MCVERARMAYWFREHVQADDSQQADRVAVGAALRQGEVHAESSRVDQWARCPGPDPKWAFRLDETCQMSKEGDRAGKEGFRAHFPDVIAVLSVLCASP
jgi:hypothetical protein